MAEAGHPLYYYLDAFDAKNYSFHYAVYNITELDGIYNFPYKILDILKINIFRNFTRRRVITDFPPFWGKNAIESVSRVRALTKSSCGNVDEFC